MNLQMVFCLGYKTDVKLNSWGFLIPPSQMHEV